MERPGLSRASWRKSSRSNGLSNCVEVAGLGTGIGIRDSKSLTGPVLTVTAAEWVTFVNGVNAGEHDLS
ncbi:DUF397 domain-containing protein [Spirillospora sp. NPDC048823]